MRLYYFTKLEHACSNLENNRIKISDPRTLNDPFEFVFFKLLIDDSVTRRETLKRHIETTNKGIICFSRSFYSPLMWAHYADNHSGVCIGFDANPDYLCKVRYRKKPMRVNEQKLSENVIEKMLSTKHIDWSYEKEERFFARFNPESSEIQLESFSKNLTPKEVILGIRSNNDNSVIASASKSSHKLDIFKARQSHNGFRVEKFEFFRLL